MRTPKTSEILAFDGGDQIRMDDWSGPSSYLEILGLGFTASREEAVIATLWEVRRQSFAGWNCLLTQWTKVDGASSLILPIHELGVLNSEPRRLLCLYAPVSGQTITLIKRDHDLYLPLELIRDKEPPPLWRPH